MVLEEQMSGRPFELDSFLGNISCSFRKMVKRKIYKGEVYGK